MSPVESIKWCCDFYAELGWEDLYDHCCESCHEDYHMGYGFISRVTGEPNDVQVCCAVARGIDALRATDEGDVTP